MDSAAKKTRAINPRARMNWVFALFFVHLFPLFRKSYKRGFKEEDLYEPLDEHKASLLGDKLENIWIQQMVKHKKTALLRAIIKQFGLELCLIGICHLVTELLYLIFMPYAVGGLVAYFGDESGTISNTHAYIYTSVIIACIALYCLSLHTVMMTIMHLAMKARVACCSLIYRKALRLSHSSLAQTTVGQIVNLISNDVSKFDTGILYTHYIWISPILAAVGTYLLYRAIGVAAYSGITFLLLFVPLQIYVGKRNSQVRFNTAMRTDKRVNLMDEVLSGMQAIKMYTWEKPFAKIVSAARRFEIKSIRVHYYLEAIMFSLELFVARTSIFISIVVFIYLGRHITANTAYTVTLIYALMRESVTRLFSFSIARVGEIITTINRLQEFLILEELHPSTNKSVALNGIVNGESQLLIKSENELTEKVAQPRIFLKSVCTKWDNESTENTLTDINLNITQGQLIAIIGAVGSGKSSILNTILKELPVNSGYLETEGVLSYACQEAWLFSASVRQNILFGAPYEEDRYKTILKVCALQSDLRLLPHGDQTIVGERGNSLSGGQKARINLARCIYKRADIYLLDDPLSAVDTKVGKKLYDDCITRFLNDKICVLVTHQLQYLKNANKIIILKKGKIVGDGSYKELQNSGLDFSKLLQEFSTIDEEEAEKRKARSRQNSELSLDRYEELLIPEDIYKEKFESGKISAATYFSYFRAGGNYFTMILLAFICVAAQASGNAGDFLINLEQDVVYTNESTLKENLFENNLTFDRKNIIYTYSGLTLTTILLAFGHSVFFFLFFMRASVNMHDSIFSKISYATMRFFNNNPVGRILNRFSKDVGIIDEYLPFILIDVLQHALIFLGTIIVTSIVKPWLLLPVSVLLVFFYFIRLVYITTSRDIKRIEGITRSPIFNHLTATIDGISTIRAFTAEKLLIREFDAHQNYHSAAWYLTIASSRAFGFWIDMICTTFISILTISFVMLSKESSYGGDIGLILTQYLSLTGTLQWGMRMLSEVENNMISVERVLEYTKIETEPVRPPALNLPLNWPEFGKIIFKNVSLRYDSNESCVLRELNFVINSGEKIGVVGRTGAGKSSTIIALFQLFEIEGTIIIDDVDTTQIPLETLRAKISIIPQIPVLFSGTMRKNLDPFEEYSDDILWNALEEVELKDEMGSHGLGTVVSEGGSNFSIGQRQLVCLARAIIKNNKILVMDEATANVDPHTDELIQNTIRKKFSDCTVITVAHRLHTVMDSDRILVMDAGRVIEYDHPFNLLQHTDSIFYSMVETTGTSASKKLRTVAEGSFMKTK